MHIQRNPFVSKITNLLMLHFTVGNNYIDLHGQLQTIISTQKVVMENRARI